MIRKCGHFDKSSNISCGICTEKKRMHRFQNWVQVLPGSLQPPELKKKGKVRGTQLQGFCLPRPLQNCNGFACLSPSTPLPPSPYPLLRYNMLCGGQGAESVRGKGWRRWERIRVVLFISAVDERWKTEHVAHGYARERRKNSGYVILAVACCELVPTINSCCYYVRMSRSCSSSMRWDNHHR